MAKQAFEGTRGSFYKMSPEDITVIGLDTKDDESHPLYDGRIHMPLEEDTVLNMMEHGVLVPIRVTKDGKSAIVIDGRRRVLHAREANRRLKKKGQPTIFVPVLPPDNDDDGRHMSQMLLRVACARASDDRLLLPRAGEMPPWALGAHARGTRRRRRRRSRLDAIEVTANDIAADPSLVARKRIWHAARDCNSSIPGCGGVFKCSACRRWVGWCAGSAEADANDPRNWMCSRCANRRTCTKCGGYVRRRRRTPGCLRKLCSGC